MGDLEVFPHAIFLSKSKIKCAAERTLVRCVKSDSINAGLEAFRCRRLTQFLAVSL